MRRLCIYKNFGGGKSRQPILTCNGERSNIQVFLALSAEEGDTRDKKVYLKGYLERRGDNRVQEIDFEERHLESNVWNLTVLRSGKTWLLEGGDWGQEDIYCKSVFEVTKFRYGDGSTRNDSWDYPITKVQLTLNNCNTVNQTKICDIEIEQNVGLKWIPTFKPKAFLNSI